MTAVTPADRPKSVRNRCVIKVFDGVFDVVTLLFDFSVGVGVFVTGLSQISSFFSQRTTACIDPVLTQTSSEITKFDRHVHRQPVKAL